MKWFTAKVYFKFFLTSFNVILPIFIPFIIAVTFNKTCLKTSVLCLGSRNPLTVLQFVSSDTRERLHYSDV